MPNPADTGRKLNVHKTIRTSCVRSIYVLCLRGSNTNLMCSDVNFINFVSFTSTRSISSKIITKLMITTLSVLM